MGSVTTNLRFCFCSILNLKKKKTFAAKKYTKIKSHVITNGTKFVKKNGEKKIKRNITYN